MTSDRRRVPPELAHLSDQELAAWALRQGSWLTCPLPGADMVTNYEIRQDPQAPNREAPWRMSGRNGDLSFHPTEAGAIYAASRQPDAGGGDFIRAADEDIRQARAARAEAEREAGA
jgi:hypothetical protein